MHLLRSCFVLGLALLVWPLPAVARERLVLMGGGPRPAEAMARFVEWAGNGRSRILVITWATQEPQEALESVRRELSPYKPGTVRAAPLAPLGSSEKEELREQLAWATGVFFSGGDQSRIMNVLRDHTLLDAFRSRYRAGAVFAGTSAGTACMSSIMITGDGDFTVIDGDQVEVRAGLGLLPGVILDQHFIKRQRQNRLFGLVLKHPQLLGVGLDEGTALLVRDNRHAEVVGASRVLTVDASQGAGELRLALLSPGETYDLKKKKRGKPPGRLERS